MLKPETVVACDAVAVFSDTENAGTGTFIRDIGVELAVKFIEYCHNQPPVNK